MGVAEIEVMYDAVTEGRAEHLALLRIGNNKALRGKCLISACQQIVAKLVQILSQICLELLHIRHLVFVPRGIIEGYIEVVEQLRACKMIASSSKLVSRLDIHQKKNRKVLHRPQGETVVPIVVVLRIDSATVEVQVPCVAG